MVIVFIKRELNNDGINVKPIFPDKSLILVF
jgi:hypothetical protein